MSGHVFHPGHHELHGITVVVSTSGDQTFVGRFDREDDARAYLKDVGVHQADHEPWDEYLERTRMYGIKVEHRDLVIARDDITSIQRLSDAAKG